MPGSISFTMAPQKYWNESVINIEMNYNSFRYRLVECQVKNVIEIPGGDSIIWQVTAVDRRWKWQEAIISGVYNRYLENGAIWKRTEKTPREMLTILMKKLGEKKFDVSKAPNSTRPSVEWQNAKAFLEADALCAKLGCRLIHNLNDSFSVMPIGEGRPIDARDGVKSYTTGLNLPCGPDGFDALFRPRYEVDIRLKAMGIEEDGTLKPINDLSYKPTNGWSGEYPGEFSGVVDKMDGDRFYQELARRSVWKMWQVTLVDKNGGPIKIPGFKGKPPKKIEEILPIYAESVAEHSNLPGNDFYNYRRMPFVWGYHVNGSLKGQIAFETDANQYARNAWRYEPGEVNDSIIETIDFSIDSERGLFIFNEPIYAFDLDDPEAGYRTPELTARVSITIRDPETLGELWHVVHRDRKVEQRGIGSRAITIQDVTADFWFDSNNKEQSNKRLIEKAANHYMDQAEKEYQYERPHTVSFNDWRPIAMSGAILEVTYERGPGGCATTASYNDRHEWARPSYEETRLLALQRNAFNSQQNSINRFDLRAIIEQWRRQRISQQGY